MEKDASVNIRNNKELFYSFLQNLNNQFSMSTHFSTSSSLKHIRDLQTCEEMNTWSILRSYSKCLLTVLVYSCDILFHLFFYHFLQGSLCLWWKLLFSGQEPTLCIPLLSVWGLRISLIFIKNVFVFLMFLLYCWQAFVQWWGFFLWVGVSWVQILLLVNSN